MSHDADPSTDLYAEFCEQMASISPTGNFKPRKSMWMVEVAGGTLRARHENVYRGWLRGHEIVLVEIPSGEFVPGRLPFQPKTIQRGRK